MVKYITLGKYNNKLKYIFLFIILKLFNEIIYELNYYSYFQGVKLIWILRIDKFENKKFADYAHIRRTINGYFGTSILAYISITFNNLTIKRQKKRESIEEKSAPKVNKITLIHEKGNENEEKLVSHTFIIIIILIWVFTEQALEKFITVLCHLDFWFFELIIIAYLDKVLLHIQIYNHHKFSFLFSIIPTILKIITIILAFFDPEPTNMYKYRESPIWIILGLLIYFILIVLKAYAIVKVKWLMDLKYISPNKLLIIYGIIGTIFCSIFSILSSFIDIKDSLFINETYRFNDYFDVFRNSEGYQIIIEIVILILRMITSYYIQYYYMMIIQYLTPVHIVFLTPFFYFFLKVILTIYNIIYGIIYDFSQSFGDKGFRIAKYSLDFSGDFFSFCGFLIFLEIIELNFWGLNNNLRYKIINRAEYELYKIDERTTSDEDSFDEDLNSENSEDSVNDIINVSNYSDGFD